MPLSPRTEELTSSCSSLVAGHFGSLFSGRFVPIFPLSLPLSILPHWLFIPALVHIREILEVPLRTIWDGHIKKSLAESIHLLWELLPTIPPGWKDTETWLNSCLILFYWEKEINLNFMKLKGLNFAWEGERIARAKSLLQVDARVFLCIPESTLGAPSASWLFAECDAKETKSSWAGGPIPLVLCIQVPSQPMSHVWFPWFLVPEPQSCLSGH